MFPHRSPPESPTTDPGFFPVYVYYPDVGTRVEEEVLVYDLDGAVAAVGGSLGLMLGFSLLSTATGGIKWAVKRLVGE